jgi:hypothetical protein
MLALGCSEILGIPDGPQLGPSDTAQHVPGSSSASATSPDGRAAALVPPGAPTPPDDEGTSTPLELVPGSAVSGVGMDHASLSPDAGSVSSADQSPAPRCPALTRPSISDFTHSRGQSATSASFGSAAAFRGGTYFYPSNGSLSSSTLDDDWHLSGTVDTSSGFGLYSSDCQPFDASAFTGIAFSVWGHIDGERQLTFYVESAAQQVSSSWLNANAANPAQPEAAPNAGRCVPRASRYDGTCREPRVLITVTSEPIALVIPWTDFAGGRPVATLDAHEITAIAWSLPPPGDSPYAFDIHIDDLRFVVP